MKKQIKTLRESADKIQLELEKKQEAYVDHTMTVATNKVDWLIKSLSLIALFKSLLMDLFFKPWRIQCIGN